MSSLRPRSAPVCYSSSPAQRWASRCGPVPGPWLGRLESGFQRNAFNYLLVLRLIPLFPFFVVNLVPAFLGVRLATYVAATFIGIIPATFVFSSVGAGLDSLFDSGREFSAAGILTPEIILALAGLAVLALLPVAYRKYKSRRS